MQLNAAALARRRSERADEPTSALPARVASLADAREQKIPVSACIITFNEEDRIADCIQRLSFCAEVVVVDAHSSDRTREICRQLGARVIERDWPGYRSQKELPGRAALTRW